MTDFPNELVEDVTASFTTEWLTDDEKRTLAKAALRAAWPMFCDIAADHFCPPNQMVTGAQREVRDELLDMKEKYDGS